MMKPRRTHLLIVIVMLALASLACALPSASDTQTSVPPAVQSGAQTGATESSADSRYLPVPGGVTITQTTPESGNGEYPTFAWEPVDGAERYLLTVFHENGGGAWAWEGAATQIMLGGFDAPPSANADGPRLTEPMQWAVVAIDAADHFIASSPLRPVAP